MIPQIINALNLTKVDGMDCVYLYSDIYCVDFTSIGLEDEPHLVFFPKNRVPVKITYAEIAREHQNSSLDTHIKHKLSVDGFF